MTTVAGAVLAGGASRRMGRDKALIPIEGSPMVVRVARVLGDVGAHPVVAVGGDAPALHRLGLETVPDRWPGEGPLGGLLTALRWSPAPHLLVVACDTPWLDTATLRQLFEVDRGDSEVVMAFTERLQPLCAIWEVERCAPALQAAFDTGERAVHHAIRGLHVRRVELLDDAPLRDIDEPGDLPDAPG